VPVPPLIRVPVSPPLSGQKILASVATAYLFFLTTVGLVFPQTIETTSRMEWSQPAPRATQSLLLDIILTHDQLVAVGERGHILISKDHGEHWNQATPPTRALLTAVTTVDGKYMWAVGHDAVIVSSTDNGETGTLISGGTGT